MPATAWYNTCVVYLLKPSKDFIDTACLQAM